MCEKCNKGKYYITPNCEFTTSMWKYCNNIYYIDEVIDFLGGNYKKIIDGLTSQMMEASEKME